jgi:hypothetical protein
MMKITRFYLIERAGYFGLLFGAMSAIFLGIASDTHNEIISELLTWHGYAPEPFSLQKKLDFQRSVALGKIFNVIGWISFVIGLGLQFIEYHFSRKK